MTYVVNVPPKWWAYHSYTLSIDYLNTSPIMDTFTTSLFDGRPPCSLLSVATKTKGKQGRVGDRTFLGVGRVQQKYFRLKLILSTHFETS